VATEAQLNPLFGPRCERHQVVKVEVFGTSILFARRGANQLLRAALRAYDVDYAVYRIESYNCRKTTGGGAWSAHSWPVAVDINPDKNPFSKQGHLVTNMPREFVDCFRTEGFGWGGDWTKPKDAMHFSLSPNERGRPMPQDFDAQLQEQARQKWRQSHGGVAAPLAATPVAHAQGVPAPAFPGYTMSYDRWLRTDKQKDPNVTTFQRRLKERGWHIATDGKFTKAVESAIRAFQREKSLAIDGKVEAKTWRAIWESPVT
jgi:D-alanyl-D-alanine carboxypeptidase/Putative peptidoglycan binding domain